jgi:ribosomal protein L37AE/L43A
MTESMIAPAATCPLCHTVDSLTEAALAAGGGWHCRTCGQRWDAARLATVVAYTRYLADRAAVAGL